MTIRAIAAPAALAFAALLLVGCAAGADTETDSPESSAPTQPAPDSGTDGEVAIPATFPLDEVPLIDGDPVFAVDLGTGWTLIFPRDDFAEGYGEAALLLEGAGFSTVANNASSEGTFGQFTTEKYTVNLTATTDPTYGRSVSYVVVLN